MRPLTFHVPTCRAKILRSRETLEALADRLVSSDPVDARGVARVRLLLTDGSGAIYARPTADDLQPALERTLVALTNVDAWSSRGMLDRGSQPVHDHVTARELPRTLCSFVNATGPDISDVCAASVFACGRQGMSVGRVVLLSPDAQVRTQVNTP
jgi:hypothetical protein